jgi:hypothetical protein
MFESVAIHGWGLFASKTIQLNEYITSIWGILISSAESDKCSKLSRRSELAMNDIFPKASISMMVHPLCLGGFVNSSHGNETVTTLFHSLLLCISM